CSVPAATARTGSNPPTMPNYEEPDSEHNHADPSRDRRNTNQKLLKGPWPTNQIYAAIFRGNELKT
ncbi:hypothetical protein ACFOW9_09645, partial [Arthrobacter cryoconiti]